MGQDLALNRLRAKIYKGQHLGVQRQESQNPRKVFPWTFRDVISGQMWIHGIGVEMNFRTKQFMRKGWGLIKIP